MVRFNVAFTPEQLRGLRDLARRRGISMSSVVREAIEAELGRPGQYNRERAMRAAGRFGSGLHDVAERHDDYLAEDFLK
jgi:hypothetical protein